MPSSDVIVNIVVAQLRARHPEVTEEKALQLVREVLQSMEDISLKVIPAVNTADWSRVQDFENTIVRWCSNEKLELSEVNGASILQALASEGWIILPPA